MFEDAVEVGGGVEAHVVSDFLHCLVFVSYQFNGAGYALVINIFGKAEVCALKKPTSTPYRHTES